MPYNLHIANKRYSTWSMRPWVLLKALDIPFQESSHVYNAGIRQPKFLAFSPSGKVPCLYDGDTTVVWDSLAIVEYLAERHDRVWPADASARNFARCVTAEMHSSFAAVREECPMDIGAQIEMPRPVSESLQRDIARLSGLFKVGIETYGGPWLAGSSFTAADAFYAPVASRFLTYSLELDGDIAKAYMERLLTHPAVQAWVEEGKLEADRAPLDE